MGGVDALDAPTSARVPLAHLSTEQIEDAIRRSGGNLTEAAKKLGVGRSTLYLRTSAEPSLLATRDEIRESFIDEAEAVIVAAVGRGDLQAAMFTLKMQGRSRGWSSHYEVVQKPEPPRRDRPDMTAGLRALSPEELMELERILHKVEGEAGVATREAEFDEIETR